MKKIWIILLIVLFFCCVCSAVLGGAYYFLAYRPAQNRLLIQPLMINAGDIPSDWTDDHYGNTPYQEGANAAVNVVYDYYYPGDARSYNWLSHEVILYPNEQSASQGFNTFKEKWLTYSGDVQVQLAFAPRNPQDQFEYKCTDASEPGHHVTVCYLLQQHGRYLIFFFPKFDDKALTAEQVSDVFTKLDARLP